MEIETAATAIIIGATLAIVFDLYRNRHARRLNRLVRRSRGRW